MFAHPELVTTLSIDIMVESAIDTPNIGFKFPESLPISVPLVLPSHSHLKRDEFQ